MQEEQYAIDQAEAARRKRGEGPTSSTRGLLGTNGPSNNSPGFPGGANPPGGASPFKFVPAQSSYMKDNADPANAYAFGDSINLWDKLKRDKYFREQENRKTMGGTYKPSGYTQSVNDEELFQQGKQRQVTQGDPESARIIPAWSGIEQGSPVFDPNAIIGEQLKQAAPFSGGAFTPGGSSSGSGDYDADIERLMQLYEGMKGNPEVQGLIANMITDMQLQRRTEQAQMAQLNPFNLSQEQFLQEEEARRYSESGEGVAEQQRLSREAEFAAQTAQQQTMYEEQTAQRGLETAADTAQRQSEFSRDVSMRQIEQTERGHAEREQTRRLGDQLDADTAQRQNQLDAEYQRFSAEMGESTAIRTEEFGKWQTQFGQAALDRKDDLQQELDRLGQQFANEQATLTTMTADEKDARDTQNATQIEALKLQYTQAATDSDNDYARYAAEYLSNQEIQIANINADKAARVEEAQALEAARVAEAASEAEARVAEAQAMATSRSAEAAAAGNPFGLTADQWMAEQALNRDAVSGAASQAQAPEMIQAILGLLNPEVLGSIGYLSGQQELPAVPTISSLRQAPNSQMNFLQGLFGAAGIEPSMLMNLIKSVSPQGGAATGSTLG
jgi:hypothetical protein